MSRKHAALAPPLPALLPAGARAGVLRVVLLVLLFVALHSLLEWRALDRPLFPLNAATADAAIAWLSIAGVPLVREGTMLIHAQGFVTDVHQVCTALLPAWLLAAGIAMHPHGRAHQKFAGLLLGAGVAVLVNQCRLVGVIWVGVHAPEWFGVAHGWVAPAGLWGLTTAFGWAWVRAVRPTVAPSSPPLQP